MGQLPTFYIGSDNGLLLARRKTVALKNATEPKDTFQWNQNQNTIYSTTKFIWLCSMQNVDNFARGLKRKTNSNIIPRLFPIINPARSKFLQQNHKHVFTISTIPPCWYGTGNWNSFSRKTRSDPFYVINTVGADDMGIITMILILLNWDNWAPAP